MSESNSLALALIYITLWILFHISLYRLHDGYVLFFDNKQGDLTHYWEKIGLEEMIGDD